MIKSPVKKIRAHCSKKLSFQFPLFTCRQSSDTKPYQIQFQLIHHSHSASYRLTVSTKQTIACLWMTVVDATKQWPAMLDFSQSEFWYDFWRHKILQNPNYLSRLCPGPAGGAHRTRSNRSKVSDLLANGHGGCCRAATSPSTLAPLRLALRVSGLAHCRVKREL